MASFQFVTGDCLDAANYPPAPADLILFDPPFWPFSKAYKQVRKENKIALAPILTPDKEHYAAWWEAVCQIAAAHLKPTGWFCFKADSWTGFLTFPITNEWFNYSQEVIWDKGKIGLGRTIRAQHEKILVYMPANEGGHYWKYDKLPTSKRTQQNLDGELGTYRLKKFHGGSLGKAFPSVITVLADNNGYLGSKKEVGHINQTPLGVWEPFLDFMCPPDGLVLDLCMGSGSVAKAAAKLNRRSGIDRSYWGIEIDPGYVRDVERYFAAPLREMMG